MKQLTFLLMLLSLSLGGFGQFRAVMMNDYTGGGRTQQVWSDGTNYRYEYMDHDKPLVLIVRREENKAFVLRPQEKAYRQFPADDYAIVMIDPVQACVFWEKENVKKIAGHEDVEGYDCEKIEYHQKWGKDTLDGGYIVYFSEKLNFPLKIEFNTLQKILLKMKVSDIRKWEPEKDYFVVPEGYTEVDEKGRPLLPEPPPPKKWKTQKGQLPFQGEVKRGTQLVFPVEEGVWYDLKAINSSGEQAKIIYSAWRDGRELTEKDQLPEKYRTLRMYPGDTLTDSFKGKPGVEMHFRAYYGVTNLSINKNK